MNMRILAVDDDPDFLDLMQSVLQHAGYTEIETANSADAALEMVRQDSGRFECFLLDVMMPGTDGVELCAKLRSMPQYDAVPVLMLTATMDEETIDRAFDAGATDYVTKPLRGLELGARIRSAARLFDQVKLTETLRCGVESLNARIEAQAKVPFSDVVDISDGRNLMGYWQLENRLLSLNDGLFAMKIFAVCAEGIEQDHARLAPEAFRELLQGIAARISSRLAHFRHFITYGGDGCFGCVVIGRRPTGDGDNFAGLAGADAEFVLWPGTDRERFVKLHPSANSQSDAIMTGRVAKERLRKAIASASAMASNWLLQENLDAKGIGDAQVVPRRVSKMRRLLHLSG
jgi:CheY-like chemotaxis protein